MKILSKEQIYKADEITIKKQQISSDALMERAALGIFKWMHQRLQGNPVKIHLFCGIGNNGGDGLALARHLKEHDYDINVYVVNYSEKRSKDFLINLDRLKDRKLWPEFLDEKRLGITIDPDDIVVDAIFGIGLNRPPSQWVGHLIQQINGSSAFVLSLDIPSGLFMDSIPELHESVIQANHVLSFQCAKLPFFLPQTGIYANQWEILDIGLDEEYLSKVDADYHLTGKYEVLPMYRPRLKFSHKGIYGHAVIVGGSYGKIGAVSLSAKACLRAGAGLVTAFVPQCGYVPLQTSVPGAMVLTDAKEKQITKVEIPFKAQAIGIGMGMGIQTETIRAFEKLLEGNTSKLVIDADGLNMLAKVPKLLHKLPKETVLTPHPKELERLVGEWKDDFEKLAKVKEFSKKYGCIIVLKGAHTIVVDKGIGYINSTGNPGMATAGSGDVLTGIITGFIAQGYAPLQASIFGVYLHGLAGDITASKEGYEAVTSSKIVENLGVAFVDLFRREHAEGQTGDTN
ncbi:MAG: NAD(P)H-hydrate dehydratase [Bacteroidota bacterium]